MFKCASATLSTCTWFTCTKPGEKDIRNGEDRAATVGNSIFEFIRVKHCFERNRVFVEIKSHNVSLSRLV